MSIIYIKISQTLTCLFLFFSLSVFSACVQANANILILGDSLSASYGLKEKDSWVSLLNQRLIDHKFPVNVVNRSISGETTQGGKFRISKFLENLKPKYVILELGANDALRGTEVNIIQSNLNYMVEKCLEKNIKVLVLGVPMPTNYGPVYRSKLEHVYVKLREKYNIPVILSMLVDLDPSAKHFQADGLHPNRAAQPIILETIWKTFKPLLTH